MIPIEGADSFFEAVQQNVESIEEYSKPHPLSTESAVVTLKRYLSKEEYRIRLSDYVDAAVEQTIQATTGEGFEQGDHLPDSTTVTLRLRRYEPACTTLMHMAAVGGYWANEESSAVWERAAERLSSTRLASGVLSYSMWAGLKMYPATLFVYAFGLGALAAGKLSLISRIFRAPTTVVDAGGTQSQVTVLRKLIQERATSGDFSGLLEGMGNRPLAINDWLHGALRQPLRVLIPDDDKYSYIFDKFEVLAALGFRSMVGPIFGDGGFPPGSYIGRKQNWFRAVGEIEESIRTVVNSTFVRSGILGDSPEDCLQLIESFKDWTPRTARRLRFFLW